VKEPARHLAGLECGGNARPIHSTTQNSQWQDVVAQRGLPGRGPAAASHVGSIGGKHGEAEAISEGSLELSALEFGVK
jgi:hypothetical protein